MDIIKDTTGLATEEVKDSLHVLIEDLATLSDGLGGFANAMSKHLDELERLFKQPL